MSDVSMEAELRMIQLLGRRQPLDGRETTGIDSPLEPPSEDRSANTWILVHCDHLGLLTSRTIK